MKFIILCVVLSVLAVSVEPHGYLHTPLARTSIHRRPNEPYRPPYEWNDSGIECRSPPNQHGSCMRCGTSADMNRGGAYDKNEITGVYNSGSIIEVVADMTANHRGYFEIDLCMSETETDNCFQRLPIVGGTNSVRDGNKMCTSANGGDHENKLVTARVQLPSGFRCNRCTLRWNYRTAYPPAPDHCFSSDNIQTFRNCADITIR